MHRNNATADSAAGFTKDSIVAISGEKRKRLSERLQEQRAREEGCRTSCASSTSSHTFSSSSSSASFFSFSSPSSYSSSSSPSSSSSSSRSTLDSVDVYVPSAFATNFGNATSSTIKSPPPLLSTYLSEWFAGARKKRYPLCNVVHALLESFPSVRCVLSAS